MSTKYIASNWRLPNQAGLDSYLNDNYGLTFSGSSEYIIIDSSTELDNVPSNPYSFSFWFKSSTAGRVLSEKRAINNFTNAQYTIHLESGYVKWYGGADGATSGTQTSNTLVDDQWHHIACVAESTTVNKIYVDGQLDVTSSANRINSAVVAGTFNIGANFSGGIRFIGEMSEFSIFNYALSSTQVSTLYGSSSLGAGNPLALKPSPVAFYPLGDNTSGNPLTQPNEAVEDASVFDFDGSSVINSNLSLDNSNGITLSLWVKAGSQSGLVFLCSNGGTGGTNSQFNFRFSQDGKLYQYLNGSFTGLALIEGLNNNEWNNIVITLNYSTGDIIGYKNTTQGPNTLTTGSSYTTVEIDCIGAATSSGTYGLVGEISNVQVWQTVLNTSEIETLYNSGVPLTGTQPQASNLKSWYKLDQSANWDVSGSGYWDIPDASGNGNGGTSSGMTSANLVLTDLTRNLPYDSYSFNFDAASSDYIDCGTGLGNSLTTVTNLTVSTWIKADITNGNDLFFNIGSFSNSWGKIAFQLNGDNLLIRINDNAYFIQKSYSSNDWNNISFVYDGSDVNKTLLYINGQEQTPDSSGGVYPSSIDLSGLKTIIGAGYNTPYTFDGKMSNVSIFNQTLTSTQVMKLYSNGMPQDLSTFTPAPVAWWTLGSNSFFNGSDFICKDLIGSNDGTSFNAGVDALKGNTPRSEANGTGSNMDIPTNLEGTTKYSSNNSWSINMSESARVADTP